MEHGDGYARAVAELMAPKRTAFLPRNDKGGDALPTVVREFRDRERADRAYHDNERALVKARDGSVDLTLRASGTTVFTHGFGRQLQGWRFIDITATAGTVLGTMPYRTAWDATTITFRNDNAAAVTVRLEVF